MRRVFKYGWIMPEASAKPRTLRECITLSSIHATRQRVRIKREKRRKRTEKGITTAVCKTMRKYLSIKIRNAE
jgi:hypothetical protein